MRQKPLLRRRRADDDINAALAYYLKEAGPEIAADLIDRLEKCLKNISEQPSAGDPRYGHELGIPGLRHRAVERFPYLIFYLERADRIEVSRVLHSKMDIPSWLDEGD